MKGINRTAETGSHTLISPSSPPELLITGLPVSIKGGVVKRGVSSAVHTIHIGAPPDAVKNRKDC